MISYYLASALTLTTLMGEEKVGQIQQFKPILSSSNITGLNIDPTTMKLPKFLPPDELMGKHSSKQITKVITTLSKSYSKLRTKILKMKNKNKIKFIIKLLGEVK
jgi:hypothetical protein